MIGVMDSGVGGVSVLKKLRASMPYESFLYLSDSLHAPYGNKPPDMIRELAETNAARLREYGCKALVVACNTATAVAIDALRKRYSDIPIVGIEPAVKPALESVCATVKACDREVCGNIAVLATDVTLGQSRFRDACLKSCAEYGAVLVDGRMMSQNAADPRETPRTRIRIFPIAAQRTVELVERNGADGREAVEYLSGVFAPYVRIRFDAVVLGCTHFPFASNAIISALGYQTRLFDGGDGVARQLRRRLEEIGALHSGADGHRGSVIWCGESSDYTRHLRTLMRI